MTKIDIIQDGFCVYTVFIHLFEVYEHTGTDTRSLGQISSLHSKTHTVTTQLHYPYPLRYHLGYINKPPLKQLMERNMLMTT